MIDYTKEEIIALMEENPEKFNDWKKESGEEIDLSETDFSNMTLKDLDLSEVDLNSSSFSDCVLSAKNFTGADLSSVEFTRAKFVECDFTDSYMAGADCSYAEITYSNFSGTDMAGCILSETVLTNSDLSSCENLSSSRFDEDTVWPEEDMMPNDFDSACTSDLSALKDDEDNTIGDY